MSGAGGGLARAGPMLDGIIKSFGGPAGLGFAIIGIEFAVERALPALEKLWAKLSDVDEMAKDLKAQFDGALKAADKLESTPTAMAGKTKQMVSTAITERGAETIESQVELGLTQTTQLESYMTGADRDLVARYQQEQSDPQARMAAAAHGQALVSQADVDAAMSRARDKRKEQAKAWVGQLPTDRASRDGLRQMDKDRPGLLGRGFMTVLDLAEPEAQTEAKAIVRGEEGAGKEMKTWGDQRKAQIKKDKKWDRAVATQTKMLDDAEKADDKLADSLTDQGRKAEAKMWADKAAADKRDAAEAKRKTDKEARESTPQAINRRQQSQEENAYLGMVQANTPGLAADLQKSAAKHARENHQAGLDMSATFQEALDYAVMQARQDFARGIQAGLKRQSSYSEMRGQ